MVSTSGTSSRLRSVSGLLALLLVGTGVGAVYATTAERTMMAPGFDTATAGVPRLDVARASASGTGVRRPASLLDKNGVSKTLQPATRAAVGFSTKAEKISATVVPTLEQAEVIRESFKNETLTQTVLVRGSEVGKFRMDENLHLSFTTSKVAKSGRKMSFKLIFKTDDESMTIGARTPFRY